MTSLSPRMSTRISAGEDSGTDNRSFTRSLTDQYRSKFNRHEPYDAKIATRAASTSPIALSTTHGKSNGLSASICSTKANYHTNRQPSDDSSYERQLSLLDPLSDRVSTILVWQNITVQIRQDKRQEFFQRMKSYKNFVPKRKCLLLNVSGAITGGLWAVMGTCSSSLSLSLF